MASGKLLRPDDQYDIPRTRTEEPLAMIKGDEVNTNEDDVFLDGSMEIPIELLEKFGSEKCKV